MYTRLFARVAGILLLLLALTGVASDPKGALLGFFSNDLSQNLVRFAFGAALTFLGFAGVALPAVKTVVGATGAVLLAAGIAGLIDPKMFGLTPGGLAPGDVILHLVLGIAALVAAFVIPGPAEKSPST